MSAHDEFEVLVHGNIPLQEIIDFISQTAKYPKKAVEEKVKAILEGKERQNFFNYKVFKDKEQEERKYFLNLFKTKNPREIAEVYAEMAIMLERALILNSYYIWKVKKLEGDLRKAKRKKVSRQKSLVRGR